VTEKEIILITASPRATNQSTSAFLADRLTQQLVRTGIRTKRIDVRKSVAGKRAEADFEALRRADAWVFVYPLYFFCLSGLLMRFLQDFDRYQREHGGMTRKAKVYAVVNCGFPEPGINDESVRVMGRFSQRVGATFRFAVQIGGGPMIHEAKDAPFLKGLLQKLDDAFARVGDDALSEAPAPVENVFISPRFPRKLYFFMGGHGWIGAARKNGLSRKGLYRKPYRT
jgi:putative NADPH-quinone reductase